MSETRTARLFKNGSSQAVRLPADFRFEGEEVYITRDEVSGDVVLSTQPGLRVWAEFFDLMETIDVPFEFMADRPMNALPPERDVFAEDGTEDSR
ncbi:MAG: AbrB/MazE/SpoVT family DNA-binding domain-containing protein [Actinobacteria bacterium]|nr:AbrB/MazE/SpoVT family DNA-binding domain-containing protein [Actinomycetota bacterium]